jgi:hypothetical protein
VDDNNRISANLLSNLSKDDNNRISANLLSNLSNITNITKTFQKDKTQKNITMTLTKQPKYNSTSNIQIFFELYDRAAVINGWNDEAKLQHIHNSFKGKLQEWVVSSTFADWASSKIALKEKQAISTKDDIYYLNKLMQIKRKNCSSLNKFISKFDEVRQKREANARINPQTVTETASSETHTERFYVNLFIKNSSPADVRRYLKQ